MRYLIDNNVVPCSWHEADVVEEENPPVVRASKVYRVNSPPKLVEDWGCCASLTRAWLLYDSLQP